MVRQIRSLLLFVILLGLSSVSQAAFKISLTDIHVQSVLQAYFPIREYTTIARVSLQDPKVRLTKNSENIVLVIPVDANVSDGRMYRGYVRFLLGVSYKPFSGSLYLNNPRIQRLDIPGVDIDMLMELQEIVETIGKNTFPLVRIYKVNEQDLNHSLAKSVLKVFKVVEGQLKVEIGFK